MADGYTRLAVRGHFVQTRAGQGDSPVILAEEDGLMLVESGRITWFGPWQEGRTQVDEHCELICYEREQLIVPGFIDTHVHYPQLEIIASHGARLLEWLQRYTFPAEMRYKDRDHARRMARFFIRELLKNGTTTAMVFCTVHPGSVEALFAAAGDAAMRIIAGKVLMDRHGPPELLDTPETGYAQSRELIETYHGRGRLLYAVTPRFAPTSSPEELEIAGRLRAEFPQTWLQTHLAETPEEVAWVRELFPERAGYLDVYHHHGLTGERCVFAHCLYLEDAEWRLLHATGSTIAWCPTSNCFLGSGLFDPGRAGDEGIGLGLASDVGGGTSLSMLRTAAEAYQVAHLQNQPFDAAEGLFRLTLGNARALGLDHLLGSFEAGKEADFVVLDTRATELMAMRCSVADSLEEQLFALLLLGDDRVIRHTWVNGSLVHERTEAPCPRRP